MALLELLGLVQELDRDLPVVVDRHHGLFQRHAIPYDLGAPVGKLLAQSDSVQVVARLGGRMGGWAGGWVCGGDYGWGGSARVGPTLSFPSATSLPKIDSRNASVVMSPVTTTKYL